MNTMQFLKIFFWKINKNKVKYFYYNSHFKLLSERKVLHNQWMQEIRLFKISLIKSTNYVSDFSRALVLNIDYSISCEQNTKLH